MQSKSKSDIIIDLKSDTVTLPTAGMLRAMIKARVGDDVFESDPTVQELESKLAGMFGKDTGLFCPSGTMSNQVAIRLHTRIGDEVICDKLSHIYNYEGGGIAVNSGASVRLLNGDRGRFRASDVAANINSDNVHFPKTSLVVIENTCNKGGGSCWDINEIKKIHSVCRKAKLKMHLDGARIFNALVATGGNAQDYGKLFDTISICLSKGLGAPVGSVLIGNRAAIKEARRIRKVMGGGMRQVGFLAAAGIYALDKHIERLKKDHQHAHLLEDTLLTLDFVEKVFPVETNIVIFKLKDSISEDVFINTLKKHYVEVVSMGYQTIRMTLHLGITEQMVAKVCSLLKSIK